MGAMDGEMHRPMALAMVALLSLSYGSYGCWKGRRASCSHSIWKKGKEAEREREKWMRVCCLLPVVGASICCRRGERRRVSLARVGSWAWQVAARRAGVEGIG